jgi:hypothetical protein
MFFRNAPPEAWLDWQQSTDDTDPQSEILYDVYLNGVRNDDGVIGYGSTITYCPGAWPDDDRDQGGRHVWKGVGAEQRNHLQLLGATGRRTRQATRR